MHDEGAGVLRGVESLACSTLYICKEHHSGDLSKRRFHLESVESTTRIDARSASGVTYVSYQQPKENQKTKPENQNTGTSVCVCSQKQSEGNNVV